MAKTKSKDPLDVVGANDTELDDYLNKKADNDDTNERTADNRIVFCEVNGLKICSGTMYVIGGKLDTSAPSGFVERGISKAPFPNNQDTINMPFDEMSNVYDTGFYPNSRCFQGYSREEAQKEADRRKKNIQIPYEVKTGNELSQSNFEFYDRALVKVYENRILNSDDPVERYDLYVMLQGFAVTPQEMIGDPRFMNSMYTVIDQKLSTSVSRQRANDKFDAISLFGQKIAASPVERTNLLDIALYMDIISRVDVKENEMYKYQFNDWLDKDPLNAGKFLNTFERFSKQDKEVPKYYRMLYLLQNKSRLQVSSDGLYIDGVPVGKDMKTAAMKLADAAEDAQAKMKVISAYNMAIDIEKEFR